MGDLPLHALLPGVPLIFIFFVQEKLVLGTQTCAGPIYLSRRLYVFSFGQSSLYASLNLPQLLAKLILGPIDGNRSSSGRSPLEPLEA